MSGAREFARLLDAFDDSLDYPPIRPSIYLIYETNKDDILLLFMIKIRIKTEAEMSLRERGARTLRRAPHTLLAVSVRGREGEYVLYGRPPAYSHHTHTSLTLALLCASCLCACLSVCVCFGKFASYFLFGFILFCGNFFGFRSKIKHG